MLCVGGSTANYEAAKRIQTELEAAALMPSQSHQHLHQQHRHQQSCRGDLLQPSGSDEGEQVV